MKLIQLTDKDYELLLTLLNKLGATDERADDLADAIVYQGGVLND